MIKDKLIEASTILARNNFISNPTLEARILMADILNCSTTQLALRYSDKLDKEQELAFWGSITQRSMATPIAYITGKQEFWKYEFFVSKDTLIPRSDSETLVEAVLSGYKNNNNLNILDLGTGSGCLIISLLLEKTSWIGLGIDLSKEALNIAQKNLAKYNLQNRLKLIASNWFDNIEKKEFDIIISNPPYIAAEERDLMSLETLMFEPTTALFANNKGLASYQIIAKNAKRLLKADGRIYLEIGYSQAENVKNIFEQANYSCSGQYKDLAGHTRCMEFVKIK